MHPDIWQQSLFPLEWFEKTEIEDWDDVATTITITPSHPNWKGPVILERVARAISDGSYKGFGPHEGFIYTPWISFNEHREELERHREIMFEEFLR